MSEPTDLTDPPLPEWYGRHRAELDACTRPRDALALLPLASGWEAVAKHAGDELAEDVAVSLQCDIVQRVADLHDLMLLRDAFEWRPLPIANNLNGLPVCYTMRVTPVTGEAVAPTVEVARLSRRGGNGSWQATLGQHLPWERRRVRDCTSYDTGKFGVEFWAAQHFGRLQTEARAMIGRPSGVQTPAPADGAQARA